MVRRELDLAVAVIAVSVFSNTTSLKVLESSFAPHARSQHHQQHFAWRCASHGCALARPRPAIRCAAALPRPRPPVPPQPQRLHRMSEMRSVRVCDGAFYSYIANAWSLASAPFSFYLLMHDSDVGSPRRTWPGSSPEARDDEMRYIVDETRTLFRKNATLREEAAIVRCIEECEQRRDLALHYRNARPRLHNAINVTPQQLRRSGQTGAQHIPSYMHSYYSRQQLHAQPPPQHGIPDEDA